MLRAAKAEGKVDAEQEDTLQDNMEVEEAEDSANMETHNPSGSSQAAAAAMPPPQMLLGSSQFPWQPKPFLLLSESNNGYSSRRKFEKAAYVMVLRRILHWSV